MEDIVENAVWFILAPLCGVLTCFLLWFFFVLAPVTLYTQAECLEKGYPKANVTIGLSRYCLNMDGAVTVKVEAL